MLLENRRGESASHFMLLGQNYSDTKTVKYIIRKLNINILHEHKWKILNKILATMYKNDSISMWGLSHDCRI